MDVIRGEDDVIQEEVTVVNIGGGILGEIGCPSDPADWLTCSATDTSVVLTTDPTGLTESPAPVSVPVSADHAINSPESIEASSGHHRASKRWGRGAGEPGGITCSPPDDAPVTCTQDGDEGRLLVSVDPTGLDRGDHIFPASVAAELSADPTGLTSSPASVDVPVTAAEAVNSPQVVTVSFTIQQPVLSLDATRLDFTADEGDSTADPSASVVTASNTGAGELSDLGGLSCSPEDPRVDCTVDQADGELTISVDPDGLAGGTYAWLVEVSAPHASNESRSLLVALTVS